MIPTPPRAAVPAQPDARPLVKILAENWKVWPAGQAVEQTSLGDVYCSTRGRSLMFGTHEIAIDQGTAVVTKDMWATQAALTAAQPTHEQIAAYLQATGTYVTNDATREAAIADAIAADRASQGAAERAAPATAGGDTEADLKEWVEAATAASRTSQVPEDFITHREAWRNALTWLRDHPEDIDDASYWAHELTVFDQAYRDLAKFSASAQTEHVAAGVSENGRESNMTGGAGAELPEPFGKLDRGRGTVTDRTSLPGYTAAQVREFGNQQFNAGRAFEHDRAAALRAVASHAQAPAGAAAPQMSAEAVRALPAEARAYIHQLEANTDPAGMVRENMQLCDTNAGLQAMYRKAADALKEVIGCFGAASDEGLAEALAETTDERLKDLLERRLMHALYAAQEAVAEPTTAQAAPAAGAVAGPDLQPLHNLLYLAQRQTSLGAIQRVVGEARLELAKVREAAPTPAAQADSGVQEDARAVSTALYQARCDTPKYCSSVQRCTAMDSQRAIKSEVRND